MKPRHPGRPKKHVVSRKCCVSTQSCRVI